jgi:hypothetical protein
MPLHSQETISKQTALLRRTSRNVIHIEINATNSANQSTIVINSLNNVDQSSIEHTLIIRPQYPSIVVDKRWVNRPTVKPIETV